MKRIIALMSGALLLVAGLCASCQKELGSQDEKSTTVDEVVVKATIAGNDTKVSFVVDGNNLKTTWQEDDHIVGWDENGSKIELEIADIEAGGKTAIFKKVSGSSAIPSSGNVYMIYAPGKHYSDITTDKTLVYDLSNQNLDKVPALMTATGTVTNNVLTLTFSNELAIVAVQNPIFPASAADQIITGLKLSGSNIQTTATFGMNGNALQMSSSVNGAITRSCNINTDADGKTSNTMVYFAVLPNDTQADVTISTTAPTSGYQIVCTGKTFTAGNCYLLSQKDINKQTFSITIDPNIQNGSINTTPSGSVAWGTSVTVTATPNDYYDIATLTWNGTSITSGGSFEMPQNDVTISGSFSKKKYSLTAADCEHGSFTLSPTTGSSVEWDADVTVTDISPATGYHLATLKYNGTDIDQTSLSFKMPKANTTVEATFELTDYTITKSTPDLHGTLTVTRNGSEVEKANYGDQITIVPTPNDGYIINAITVKNASDENVDVAYETFTMPASDVTVTVTFKAQAPSTNLPDYTIEVWE